MGTAEKTPNSPSDTPQRGGLDDLVLLDAADLRAVLTPEACLNALEDAYRHLHAAPNDKGRTVGFQAESGTFHVKAGVYPGTRAYFAAKVNANYPDNPRRQGLPTIQGLIVLCDGTDGRPLAILQSAELTGRRTAAATALAAKYGARSDSRTLALIGCGAQSPYQVQALLGVLQITHMTVHDRDEATAGAFMEWGRNTLGIETACANTVAESVEGADVIVTCTPSTEPILNADMIAPGCFIAAVGADSAGKQELAPGLFANARILVDDVEQCAKDGDLAHAIRAKLMSADGVAATLADLAAGAVPGRTHEDEIVIFDSTGSGLQDVAAAVAAYEAVRRNERADD